MLNNMIKNDRITSQYITSLREGEIFVFGSNKEGMHGGGAARIGCGIAGWHDSEIAPLFKEASALDNVTLPEEFWNALGL